MAKDRSYAKLGTSAVDLALASKERMLEAELLMREGRYASAIAMGIYSLEILLKVRICRVLDLIALPTAFEIHNIDELLILSGLSSVLNNENNSILRNNWNEIKLVSIKELNDLRYTPSLHWDRSKAEDFFLKLNHPDDGVFVWISNR